MTRASLFTNWVNNYIKSNGIGAITGPVLNAVLTNILNGIPTLDDSNQFSGLQIYTGGVSETRVPVANTNYNVIAGVRLVAFTSISAPRTVQLLPASSYQPGQRITIIDETGLLSASLTITINPNGADTINGANASTVLSVPRHSVELESNGTNGWTKVRPQLADLPAGTILGNPTAASGPPLATSDMQGFRNRIINGKFLLDQRNAGGLQTGLTNATYLTDRIEFISSQSGKFSAQQNAGSLTPPSGFANYQGVTVTTPVTVGVNDFFGVGQSIEGYNIADLKWGTASAQPATLSFWAYSSVAGTHSGAIYNSSNAMCYPFSYSLVASTWTYVTVTIPGPTSGTWLTTNGIGIGVRFNLGSGTNLLNPAGTWVGSSTVGATGSVSIVATNGATFNITGLQLEPGNFATAFEHRPYGVELSICQRYYQKAQTSAIFRGLTTATTGTAFFWLPLQCTMRVAPSMTVGSPTYTNASAAAFGNIAADGAELSYTISGTANSAAVAWTASADL